MDYLNNRERILSDITLGESHFREFKSALEGPPENKKPREASAIRKDIGEALVAFANADGGVLLVGVEDDGTITGVPHSEDKLIVMLGAYQTQVHKETPLPTPKAFKTEIDGRVILVFSVEKGAQFIHLTSDGRCMQRRDRENIPVSSEKIHFERQEQISRTYDRAFVDGATVADLDQDILVRLAAELIPGMSIEKLIQFLGLGEYSNGEIRIRKAALLLFAKNINYWHPRCELRILKVKGTEILTGKDYNVVTDETCTGNIFNLLSKGWDIIRPHLVETKFISGSLFKEIIMYPEEACREALTNAIAHRDYSIEGRNIEIFVFEDRIEVKSPGGLLTTITVESLKSLSGLHQSRNAFIARVLRESGYMLEMGEGIRRIYDLMRLHDLVPPELLADRDSFSIILRHRSVFSGKDQMWLDEYSNFHLTRDEMLFVVMGRTGELISPQQIRDILNIVDTEDYRQIVDNLMLKGILYSKISNQTAKQMAFSKGVNARNIGRFAILPPDLCNRFLGELLDKLAMYWNEEALDQKTANRVRSSLSQTSPYKFGYERLIPALKLLKLIDAQRIPVGTLKGLIKKRGFNLSNNITNNFGISHKDSEEILSLFVHNLDYEISVEQLREVVENYGTVISINIPKDYSTGKSRGFAFLEVSIKEESHTIIENLNGSIINGRITYFAINKNK